MSSWTKELIGAAIPFKKGAVAFFTVDLTEDPIGNLEWLLAPGESAKRKHETAAAKMRAVDKHEGTADCSPCVGEDTLYASIIKDQLAGIQLAYAADAGSRRAGIGACAACGNPTAAGFIELQQGERRRKILPGSG